MAKNTFENSDSTPTAGGATPAAEISPSADAVAAGRAEKAAKRSKRKAARLRGVWVSFTGRIVAQFVGSAASIVLGMLVVHSYRMPDKSSERAALAREPGRYQGRTARAVDAGGERRPSIVILPIDDYSEAASGGEFARALTESVTASVAEGGSMAVLSRTSASALPAGRESVPVMARELGVDFVLEASITRSSNRMRVIAQLIDGQSDEHVWTWRYEREAGDALGVQGEVADRIASGIEAAVAALRSAPAAQAVPAISARNRDMEGARDGVATADDPRSPSMLR